MNLVSDLINSFDPSRPNFRPTEIFNESWLVKLVLHQASQIQNHEFPLSFEDQATWFSEALLPTAFKARYRGDILSESRTNADGVIGHIVIGAQQKADLELTPEATQLSVVEAKINSPLAHGVTNAKYFDQAARNVACIAEVVSQAGRDPSSFDRLDFIVLAPQASIDNGTFQSEISPSSIQEKVEKRVEAYEGSLDIWYEESFIPTMKKISIYELSWEASLAWIYEHKPEIEDSFQDFYQHCLRFN